MIRKRYDRWWAYGFLVLLFFSSACRQGTSGTATATATMNETATATVQATVAATPTATVVLPTSTAAPAATSVPVTPSSAAFEEASCAFEVPQGRDVRCGYLEVPEERSDPANQNTARLHVAIFASDSEDPLPDPLVYLEGGPGGDALESIPYAFEERFAPFLADRDLIMFDQRGTGYSQPSLDCPEYRDLSLELLNQILPAEEEERLFLETMGACRERLIDEGVTLGAYDSAASAADLEDLRQALGYERWNLLGISYGTRLALTTMRDYPQGLRSVILDSTYPLAANIVTETPANFARAMDVFFTACATDEACDQEYPDLRNTFFELVAGLNASPISVPVRHALSQQRYEARVSGDDLLGVFFQGLYSEEIIPLLPQFIYETKEGDFELLSALLSNLITNDDFFSIGMNFSVQCQEEIPFSTLAEAQAAATVHPELAPYFETNATSGETAFAACALWDVPAALPLENQAVLSDVPTLILAGEFDPITPPAWGAQVQTQLPNSYLVAFPALAHGVSLAGDCPRDIVNAFLAEPSSPPDDTCAGDVAELSFITPGSAPPVELVPVTIDLFGVELDSVAPDGWEEVSTGIFARQLSALDQTALLQQAAPGIAEEEFLALLTTQLGLEADPRLATTLEAGGKSWSLYEADAEGALIDIGLAEDQGITYVVLLFSHEDERAVLYDAVFLPALSAIDL